VTCQEGMTVMLRYGGSMNVQALQELIEDKFAPGPLLAVQGLVNTYSFEDDEELMSDPEGSELWLRRVGLIGPKVKVSPEDHRELIQLREAVRAMLEANHTGRLEPGAAAKLRRLAADHPAGFTVEDDGGVALDLRPAGSAGELIAQTIGIVADAQSHDRWRRLKICAADDCRWAFYDSSKNRGGTWCRMEVCGNRVKNRRYRSRSAAEK